MADSDYCFKSTPNLTQSWGYRLLLRAVRSQNSKQSILKCIMTRPKISQSPLFLEYSSKIT